MTMPMNLAVDLTERELTELCRRTNAADRAGAVSRAAREFLRTCRLRELTAMAGKLDYDEHAWRELDAADLSQPAVSVNVGEQRDG
jgi:hypothetical protein